MEPREDKGSVTRQDESLSRRELLRKLGCYSAVAAGVLSKFTVPVSASPFPEPSFPFLADDATASSVATVLGGPLDKATVRAGDIVKVYAPIIDDSSAMFSYGNRLSLRFKVEGDKEWNSLAPVFSQKGWVAFAMPILMANTGKEQSNVKISIRYIYPKRSCIPGFTCYDYVEGTVTYKRSGSAKKAGAKMRQLARDLTILLLDADFLAQTYLPADLLAYLAGNQPGCPPGGTSSL